MSILVRREIEALIAAPLIRAYMDAFGKEPALEVARGVVKSLALQGGKMLAVMVGGTSMEHLNKALPMFSMGGALEFDVVETGPTRAAINVTRCRYADMYKEHGMQEYGYLLSCGRDSTPRSSSPAPRPSWKGRISAISDSPLRKTEKDCL